MDDLQHVPHKRVRNSVVEHIGGVPMSQIWEPIVEVTHHVPQERVQDRTPEQFVDIPVPRIVERADEVVRVTPWERVQNLTLEHIVDVPVPQIMKAAVEVVHAPQECVQSRTPEQIVDEPVRPVMEAALDVVHAPWECVQNRTREQIVDVPVPHIKEDGLLLVPQERVNNRAAMTRHAWWTLWVPSRVSTSTICLDLEMSWCPRLRSKSRLSTLVGQGSFGKFLRRMLWSGSRIQQRLLEQNLELFKINAQKRVQRRFSEVEDLVVVSEDSRLDGNASLRGWPGLMPSWHRCPKRRRWERRRSQKCSLRASKASSVPDSSARTSCGGAGATMATDAPSHMRSTNWQMKGGAFLGLPQNGEVCTVLNTIVIPQVCIMW